MSTYTAILVLNPSSCSKGTNPVVTSSNPNDSQRPHLQTPSHGKVGRQHVDLWGTLTDIQSIATWNPFMPHFVTSWKPRGSRGGGAGVHSFPCVLSLKKEP